MKDTVIVRLKGGLGNQLFQYTFGRAYAEKYGLTLKLDITDYPRQTLRSYGLDVFTIQEDIASDDEVRQAKYPYGILSKFQRLFNQKILKRDYIGFNQKIVDTPGLPYLDGFFQSEKYFLPISDTIRKEFTLKKSWGEAANEITKKIKETSTPVSLHVRRGDFVSSAQNSAFHAACSPRYYQEAMRLILEKYSDATFFVFSDDIEWVKQSIAGKEKMIYVSNDNIKDYEEILLMSLCRHHIIANSSFSWWGAWLNPIEDKMVVAPLTWRADSGDYNDIIPSTWIQIPNQPQ